MLTRIASVATLLAPAEAAAHAFRERYDLPLPLSLWLLGAGLAVLLSFVVFALSLRPGTSPAARVLLQRLPAALVTALRVASLCVLLVVIGAGLLGTQDPFRNFAPAFVWIAWWIGFTYLCALLGDLWSLASPWHLLAGKGIWKLPPPVGAWPAVVLFLAFAWIEIVWHDNAVPRNIAALAIGYTLATWAGMLAFGREAWLASGEVFAVYFRFIARLAPLEWRASGELRLRAPAGGLLDSRPLSASEAFFVIAMLATVTFDGLRETPFWAVRDSLWTAATTAGLLAMPLVFALVIFIVCAWMARLVGAEASPGELVRLFVPTLLPIALAYHIAHYLSYLLIAGQVVIALASDPLGRGWDLFGTAHYEIDPDIVGARFAWYTSIVVIVLGHVLAMYAAHRVALARFADRHCARRSQYPLAALMVGYTVLSLWILAQPIVLE